MNTARTPLWGFLAAEAVSLTGTRVSMVAIPWFVLTTTGSAAQTGVIAFAEMAPLVLAKALAGPLVDRVGARRVAVTADLLSVVAVGLVPLLHNLGVLGLPLLLVLVAVAGTLRGPGDGAKQALVPSLASHADVPLERVTGISGAVERTASTLGALAAGGLVVLVGAADALVLDAASFAISGLLLLAAVPADAPGAVPNRKGGPGYLADLHAGWDFLRRDSTLVAIVIMVAVTNLLDQAYVALLVPVWARSAGMGAGAVGLLFAVFSGFAVLGALMAATWATRLPRYPVYLVGFLLAGAPKFVVLALGAPLAAVLAVGAVGGLASGFINPVLGAVIFERLPEAMIGRVSALITALCWSLLPLGGLLGGLLVAGVGVSAALLATGAAYLAATMAPALRPRSFVLDRSESPPEHARV